MTDDILGWLLGPGDAARFFDDHYEQRALVVDAGSAGFDPARFAAILTLDDVDRLVTSTDLRRGDLVLADASVDGGIPSDDYVDAAGYVDRGAVVRRHRGGATIILNQAHRFLPGLGALCQGFEARFSCHVQTNLYLTPARAQGFATHFDSHDVFVLQIVGEKSWSLYGTPLAVPYRGERFESRRHDAGELVERFALRPGDVAYVPRGMMHDAASIGGSPSLHITVGLIGKSWADLVLEAVAEVALREPSFRRTLPPGFARDEFDRTDARATLQRLGAVLARELRLDPAMDLLADEFVRTRPALAPGAVVAAGAAIAGSTRFAAVPHCVVRREQEAEGDRRMRLIVPGGELWFTKESAAALDRALAGDAFTLRDLEFEHAEALVRRLVDYGLVRWLD